jgi:hypothetical protein
MKICQENPHLFKIGQKYRAFQTMTQYVLLLSVTLNRHKNALLVKWRRAVGIAEEVKILCERTTRLRYSTLHIF